MKFIIDDNKKDESVIKIILKEDKDDVQIIGINQKTGIEIMLGCFSKGSLILFTGVNILSDLNVDNKDYLEVKYFFLGKTTTRNN